MIPAVNIQKPLIVLFSIFPQLKLKDNGRIIVSGMTQGSAAGYSPRP
ncbi:hypothetical protein [uncultured Dialister sp.]|nr:hypothetical protein [uncultured Dialister sp.]